VGHVDGTRMTRKDGSERIFPTQTVSPPISTGKAWYPFHLLNPPNMHSKIHVLNGVSIDYSKSSVQLFPAMKQLADSSGLYLKFSKNHIKTMTIQQHAELSLDFDLCLIDSVTNETIIQLFAIFTVTKGQAPVNEWQYVTMGVDFARELVTGEIEEKQLKDKSGNAIQVPVFTLNPESINFSF
jgi:hypothetical protein